MPGYLTKQESIAVQGVANLHIRSLFDISSLRTHWAGGASRHSAATWPLFDLLWPSGAELAAHIALRPVTVRERHTGNWLRPGSGQPGGHRRGADMTASDCHPLAAQFLAENLRLNGMAAMKYRHGLWGTRGRPTAHRPCRRTHPARRHSDHTNEPTPPLPLNDGSVDVCGRFDLIMGSDVLYERDDSGGLAHFIEEHATASAEVWIVDPHRGNRPAFNRRMTHLGFDLTEQRLDRLASLTQTAYKGAC
jgi:predicted nicotinamide N-methyase